MDYVVLTTPSCVKCKTLKKIAQDRTLTNIEFVELSSERGQQLKTGLNISAVGVLVEVQTGKMLTATETQAVIRN